MDFYIIPDDKPKPDSLTEIKFAGSISEIIFDILQNENLIEKRFDYYTDFRLTNDFVKSKLDLIDIKNLKSNPSVFKFKEILEKANVKNNGLLAYSD